MVANKGKARVLVIEDEQSLRQALEIRLLQEGYRVDVAGHGREGLEKVEQATPDVILLDLLMPVMDGVDFLKELRVERKRKIPVVVLTVMPSGVLFEQCKVLGVEDYLVKDRTELDEIVAKVKEMVG